MLHKENISSSYFTDNEKKLIDFSEDKAVIEKDFFEKYKEE